MRIYPAPHMQILVRKWPCGTYKLIQMPSMSVQSRPCSFFGCAAGGPAAEARRARCAAAWLWPSSGLSQRGRSGHARCNCRRAQLQLGTGSIHTGALGPGPCITTQTAEYGIMTHTPRPPSCGYLRALGIRRAPAAPRPGSTLTSTAVCCVLIGSEINQAIKLGLAMS